MNSTFTSFRCASAAICSAPPTGGRWAARSGSERPRHNATPASTIAAATQGHGPRQKVAREAATRATLAAVRAAFETDRIYCAAVMKPCLRRSTWLAVALCLALTVAATTACGPRDPLERARWLQDDKKDFAGSLELLRGLLEQHPDDAEVNYRYGVALIASGQPSLARWALRKAMESPEWVERAGVPLATTAILLGGYDEAVEIATQVLAQQPDNAEVLVLRADARVRTRREYAGALADADRALELEPDNVGAMVPKVVALLGLHRQDEAAAALDALDAAHSDAELGLRGSPALCAARATFAKERGEVEEAAKRFDECLKQFPAEGMVVGQAIAFFDANGRRQRSEEILQNALAAQP